MFLTIICLLSREEKVDMMLRQIKSLDTGDYAKRILIVIDNSYISTGYVQSSLIGCEATVVSTGKDLPFTHDLVIRRGRITEAWQLAQKTLKDKYKRENWSDHIILGVEDDCIFKATDFSHLIKLYEEKRRECNCGFVSGVQAGRWGKKMIGAWRVNNKEEPTEIESVPFHNIGIYPVDAAGFYFFICGLDLILKHKFMFGFFGPDVYFGMTLAAKGYQNFIDYSLIIPHDNGIMPILPDGSCEVLHYVKNSDKLWKLKENE